MEDDREWMYAGWKKGGCHTKEWFQKTEKFLENARGESTHAVIRCPCTKCGNIQSHDKRTVALHLCSHGYVQGYKVWDNHGESRSIVSAQMEVDDGENVDRLDHMLEDMQAVVAPPSRHPGLTWRTHNSRRLPRPTGVNCPPRQPWPGERQPPSAT